MHQYFVDASTTCDPYLPDNDTPHGGEKERGEEDAVIAGQQHPRMTATRS